MYPCERDIAGSGGHVRHGAGGRSARLNTAGLVLVLLVQSRPAATQEPSTGDHLSARPRATAVERQGRIDLDGVLTEATWQSAPATSEFRQYRPDEGRPAQRTEVRFAFDAEALFIGARMFDSLGARGVRTRLVRRDQITEGDYLQFVFDTFHDHAGRTIFTVNPSGVKGDAGQASPGADPSWDPVWRYAARTDSLGWTAEIRIPWSQLRFKGDSAQLWGMQIWRYVERIDETSMWAFWGRQESGGPQRFGHLVGLRVRSRPRGVELMPYALTRASYVRPTQPGSPFQDASEYGARAGADARVLLGSSFTLSATINPDFGQVEQDPAVVNLSAFESFFEEKRPFFVEGSGLLFFGGFECFSCSNVSGMNIFYSRRIGRAPQGAVPATYEYREVPRNAELLGAVKLTGRTRGGWQIGVLEAVTRREVARVEDVDGGVRTDVPVEPLTNYWVGRVRRTTLGGRATWGLMGTSVIRGFDGASTLRAVVPSHAEALGADWSISTRSQSHRLIGTFVLSSVGGDSLSVARLQRTSARYFHRPDRDHGSNRLFSDAYDPSATSLRGYGGYLRASRDQGPWRWDAMVNFRSPGFEVNDLAFLQRVDYVWMNANLMRVWTRPGAWYRGAMWIAGTQQQFNYDGDRTDLQFHQYASTQFTNYWNASLYANYRPAVFDDRMTRGGAVVRRSASWYVNPTLSTDARRALVVSASPSVQRFTDGSSVEGITGSIRVKPATSLQITAGPSYTRLHDRGQYVQQFADSSAVGFFGRRAVFSDLRQSTASLITRVNWTFTPELSLELFAQPFVSHGRYSRFQEYTRPRSSERAPFDSVQIRPVATDASGRVTRYRLDPDRDAGTANFDFANPDFDVRSLRGSAVARWEYRPGSTLFVVWQQERNGAALRDEFALDQGFSEILRERPNNVFVVKASYWIGR